jgi:hypothetical protein
MLRAAEASAHPAQARTLASYSPRHRAVLMSAVKAAIEAADDNNAEAFSAWCAARSSETT